MTQPPQPAASMDPFPTFDVGDVIDCDGRPLTVNEKLYTATMLARAVLIAMARAGRTITYQDLSYAIGGQYMQSAVTHLLYAVSRDCWNRGELTLAALAVNKATGKPGSGLDFGRHPADVVQKLHYDFWQHGTPYPPTDAHGQVILPAT